MKTFENFGINYERKVLSNGSEVRLLNRKGFPIHIQACIHAGTIFNTIPGLAHFTEHMLVSGTKTFPTKLALTTALDEVGGTIEASTDRDLLRVTLSIPSKDSTSLALTILKEVLTESTFEESTFQNEQQVIFREQKECLQNVPKILMDGLQNKLFSDYELRFNNIGTASSVGSIKVSDVTNFVNSNISADRTTYIISGDIEMSEFEELLSQINLPSRSSAELPALSLMTDNSVTYVNRTGDSSDLLFGFRCDTTNTEEIASLILMHQLCQGRSSRFLQELRYAKGLVYGGSTILWDYNGTSIFSIKTSCGAENISSVFDIISTILKDIATNGVSESQCAALKIKLEGQFIFSHQTSKEWLDAEASAVRHKIEGGTNRNALTILSIVDEIDVSTLNKNIKKYFDLKNAHCITVGTVTPDVIQHIKDTLK